MLRIGKEYAIKLKHRIPDTSYYSIMANTNVRRLSLQPFPPKEGLKSEPQSMPQLSIRLLVDLYITLMTFQLHIININDDWQQVLGFVLTEITFKLSRTCQS